MDLQNKNEWCGIGAAGEDMFLRQVAPLYGWNIVKHPNKETDIYETDFQLANGLLDIDLKHVETPFFKAARYQCDPNFTVTFNHKDYIRYRYKYPEWSNQDMVILFWVNFEKQKRYDVSITSLSGVWSLRLSDLDEWIRQQKVPCQSYLQRVSDAGTNAKHSWLIDLRDCREHRLRSQSCQE